MENMELNLKHMCNIKNVYCINIRNVMGKRLDELNPMEYTRESKGVFTSDFSFTFFSVMYVLTGCGLLIDSKHP